VQFWRLEPLLSAILRNLLEDPATLEAWMEAEVRSFLLGQGQQHGYMNPFRALGGRSCLLSQFLGSMGRVIGREPAVFLQALAKTCTLELSPGGGSEVVVTLKKGKEPGAQQGQQPAPAAAAATPAPAAAGAGAAAAGDSSPIGGGAAPEGPPLKKHKEHREEGGAGAGLAAKTPAKTPRPPKKTIPSSFVEVIDTLLDLVTSYTGAPRPAAAAAAGGTAPAAMDLDQPPQPPADQPAAQQQHQQQPDDLLDALQAAKTVPDMFSAIMTVPRELIHQSFALKALTDFCLLFNSTVGLLLKRDGDGSSSAAATPAPASHRKAHRGADAAKGSGSGSASGGVIRHLMHYQLLDTDTGAVGLEEAASRLLQAVCIRSAEGRKRVISEVVATLTAAAQPPPADSMALQEVPGSRRPDCAYRAVPAAPPPLKVKAFVELVGSLVHAQQAALQPDGRQPPPGGMSSETVKAMREAGMVKALAMALRQVDLSHPAASKAINAVLKPLEVLTRSMAAWTTKPPPAAAAGAATGTQPATGGSGQPAVAAAAVAATPAPGAARAAAAGAAAGADTPAEGVAAGPEAVQAAQRMMRASQSQLMGMEARDLMDAAEMMDLMGDEDDDDDDLEGMDHDMDDDDDEDDDDSDGEGGSGEEEELGAGGEGPSDEHGQPGEGLGCSRRCWCLV
jgi:hypothetical protein